VFLGSGITADNLSDFFEEADGFIVGSHFKVDGHWANTIDPKRVERFMEKVRR
jgi:predicted TIM-barrel enzyme